MKYKINFICTIILICFFSSSCTPKYSSSVPLTRTYSEYKKLSEEEQLNLIAAFDQLSADVLKEEILRITQKYLSSQESSAYKIKSITLTKDNLLLSSNENRKIRSNGILLIDFILQDDHLKSDEDAAMQFMEDFFIFLYGDLLVSSQIMSIEIFAWSDEETILTSYGGGMVDITFAPYLTQKENEYNAQTIAYDFGESIEYLSLRKFGLINESELYIEYLLTDENIFLTEESVFKNHCTEITTLLLSDEDSMKFIQENKTTKITLVFSTANPLTGNSVVYSLNI